MKRTWLNISKEQNHPLTQARMALGIYRTVLAFYWHSFLHYMQFSSRKTSRKSLEISLFLRCGNTYLTDTVIAQRSMKERTVIKRGYLRVYFSVWTDNISTFILATVWFCCRCNVKMQLCQPTMISWGYIFKYIYFKYMLLCFKTVEHLRLH